MDNEKSQFLKRRAIGFLEDAKSDYSRECYDLVLFHVEQFIQLYSKYLLYRRIGDYPKTRSLTRLIRDLIKVYEDCKLREFYEKNLEMLYLLEEAYISSRYIPREYDKEIAKRVLDFAEKIMEVLECLEKH